MLLTYFQKISIITQREKSPQEDLLVEREH